MAILFVFFPIFDQSALIQRSFHGFGESISKKCCLPNFLPRSIWKSGGKRQKKFCLWNNGKLRNFDQDKVYMSGLINTVTYRAAIGLDL